MTSFRVLIAFVVLAILGFATVPLLSVDLNPREREPVFTISFGIPQSSPEVIEKLGTSPLEGVMSQLTELKKITSVSNYDRGSITLRFDKKADMELKKFEVLALIRQVYHKMDERLSYPIVTQSAESRNEFKTPILTYSVNGPFASFEIKKIAEDMIKPALTRFAEVEEVQIRGANDLQVYVTFDVQKMQAFGVTKAILSEQISKSFGQKFPGTVFNSEGETLFVTLDSKLNTLDQLENLIVRSSAQLEVRVKDLASVTLEEAEPTTYYRINGNNSVTMAVYNRDGVNKVLLAKSLKASVESAKINLPAGFDIRLENDDTEFLEKELNKIYQRSGLSILILIAFIFLINRNWK